MAQVMNGAAKVAGKVVHAAGSALVEVVCLPNVQPGTTIVVTTPNGPVTVVVPPGTRPGQTFHVTISS